MGTIAISKMRRQRPCGPILASDWYEYSAMAAKVHSGVQSVCAAVVGWLVARPFSTQQDGRPRRKKTKAKRETWYSPTSLL